MIKLVDLLKEIDSFKNINEYYVNGQYFDPKKAARQSYDPTQVNEVIQAAEKMGLSNIILWRTIKKEMLTPIEEINNPSDRSFRGLNLGSKTILNELGVTNPVFAFFESSTHYVFGNYTYIIVLKQPYKIYQSEEVKDVMAYARNIVYQDINSDGGTLRKQVGTRTDEEVITLAKEGAKTYQDVTDGKPLNRLNEAIIQAEKYWLVRPAFFLQQDVVGKFADIKKFDGNSTYGDLINALKSYKKYQDGYADWLKKRSTLPRTK